MSTYIQLYQKEEQELTNINAKFDNYSKNHVVAYALLMQLRFIQPRKNQPMRAILSIYESMHRIYWSGTFKVEGYAQQPMLLRNSISLCVLFRH